MKLRTYRIFSSPDEYDYEDYEAANFEEAMKQYRKESGHYLCYSFRILKEREKKIGKRKAVMC